MDSQVDYALEMIGVTKRFPGTLAVDRVDLQVAAGEVHALLGENGAGKSTLMKMLAGAFADYAGEIRVGGRTINLHSPAMAKAHGIAMVHQELDLSGPQSIAENILAGSLPTKAGIFIDRRRMVRETKDRLARVGLELDPETPVEQLSQHEAQLVEIAKALGGRPQILVLDEPTSALTRDDVEILFAIIRRLQQDGLAIVYISHHLSEVFLVADRATVMRDGKVVGVREVCGSSPEELVAMMVGRTQTPFGTDEARAPGPVLLRAEGLSRDGFFDSVSFSVAAGEIVGICGLAGSGRSEIARSLCGIDPLHGGKVTVDAKPVRIRSLAEALKLGIAYVSEDRKLQGLALRLNVGENILSAVIPRQGPGPIYSGGASRSEITDAMIRRLNINPPDPWRLTRNLSGGNQQKVLLAKWLAVEPRVVVLDEPTRGVDVGAKATIHEAIRSVAAQGKGVLLISSDLPELSALSDRILVVRKGRIIGELPKAQATEDTLLLAANGVLGAEA